jgi:hypothetical protein
MSQRKTLEALAAKLERKLAERAMPVSAHGSGLISELLMGAIKEAGGRGIGGVLERDMGIDILYIDMGGPYRETIVYDGLTGRFAVSGWENVVDAYETLYEHEVARDENKVIRRR